MRAEIDTSCFTSHSLLDLLHACPTISHLHLFASYSDIFLLDETFLAYFAPPQNLCLMLTHAIFTRAGPGLPDAAVLPFIWVRMAAPTPLQLLEINFLRAMQIDIMPELQPLISDGLQVSLDYPEVARWKFDARAGLAQPNWE
jgi:hypothetical protein